MLHKHKFSFERDPCPVPPKIEEDGEWECSEADAASHCLPTGLVPPGVGCFSPAKKPGPGQLELTLKSALI